MRGNEREEREHTEGMKPAFGLEKAQCLFDVEWKAQRLSDVEQYARGREPDPGLERA